MPAVADIEVIDDHEAAALFSRHLAGKNGLVLAVSGGSDSMALMRLAARWNSALEPQARPDIHVVTVDHGLRPEAAAEAEFVVREATSLGLSAQILQWDGPHPETGVPAAAREARYALMAEVCRHQQAVLVTAHTLEDQAETLVMALARGAGVDGLSAMQPETELNGLTVIRPLLEISRARLRATLMQSGVSWVEDPTNSDAAYERVRVREALKQLEQQGVSHADLARSSRRLSRARQALVQAAVTLTRDAVVHEASGFARIGREPFFQAPDEIQLRCVLATTRAYGGGMVQSLAGAEGLLAWMQAGTGKARTFGGCRIVRRAVEFVVGREADRINEAPVRIEPGQCIAEWDRRYNVSAGIKADPAELMVLRDVDENLLPARPATVPDFVWQGLPVVIAGENQVIMPVDGDNPGSQRQQNVVFHRIAGPKTAQS
ncbi:tRNA lysidine(34) synthetase TilS [Anderseniella sp. Alg231-50]|uniref:tRNA lysidine(34) synthetase TilS n=1 Tax=Anderseniella sp. Alg231-50 TaxID=1922226 RepID=UPI00307BB1E0